MSKNLPIQEVEHENLVLSQELISIYKKRISELENEIIELKSRLSLVPINLPPVPMKRKVATISELSQILEDRSRKLL